MRIAVAMSGGVDSAVAALLLARAGHDVVGLSMQLLDASAGGEVGRCCSGDDLADARATAAAIGIPHYVLDFEEVFRREVRAPFSEAWLAGETPVPCLDCNSKVKFAPLLARATALGCERLATGHYARIVETPDGPRVARAADPDKDQSWYLYELEPANLARLLFPLGALTKAESRRLAAEAALPVASKPESQEICFVPPGRRYDEIVDAEAPAADRSGRFVSPGGEELGRHDGFHRFTVGQRRGLGTGFGERRYVLAVHPGNRDVVLGDREELLTSEIRVRGLRWWGAPDGSRCDVRIRSRGADVPARLEPIGDGRARILFDSPVLRTAPGQAAVAYRDGIVLGGGRIERE